jgi:hypothetical protein
MIGILFRQTCRHTRRTRTQRPLVDVKKIFHKAPVPTSPWQFPREYITRETYKGQNTESSNRVIPLESKSRSNVVAVVDSDDWRGVYIVRRADVERDNESTRDDDRSGGSDSSY